MYPLAYNIPGAADRSLIRFWKASQGVHSQLANISLPYCRYIGIVLVDEKIVSNSVIYRFAGHVYEGLYLHSVCL